VRGSIPLTILLGFALGCGAAKPPAPDPARAPINWHDHTGPNEAYTVRFPAPPERAEISFDYITRGNPVWGQPQQQRTARGATLRATVDGVTYELTKYEDGTELFESLCDTLGAGRLGAVRTANKVDEEAEHHGGSTREAEIKTAEPEGRVILRHVSSRRGLYELRVTVPAGVDPGDAPRTFLDSFRLPPYPLTGAAKLRPFLAAAVDPAAGVMFVATTRKELIVYDYPAFTERVKYSLGRFGTRLAFDTRRGVLWAVLCDELQEARPGDKRNYGDDDRWASTADRGQGRVFAFDVRPILNGERPAEWPKPVADLPEPLVAARLTLSPDGQWLYYLDAGAPTELKQFERPTPWHRVPKSVKLGRIDLTTRKLDRVLPLVDGTEDFVVPPNGKQLYATASPRGHESWRGHTDPPFERKPLHGLVQVIDPDAFKATDTIEIDADPFSAAATDAGLVYITGGSDQHTDLVVLDVRKRKVVSRWPSSVSEFSQIDMNPDGKWLAMSPHVDPGFVEVYDLRRNPLGHNLGDVESHFSVYSATDSYGGWKHEKDMGGGVQFTPDGRFILDRRGVVLRLTPP
jgi:hypothetical protein